LRQARAARALEAEWSKDEILEAYLNLASFRGETQGIGAAARALFGRAPDALGREDSLLLAALLPAPQAAPTAVARRACRLGRIADCTMMTALAEAMTGPGRRLADDPGLAPHLAYRLLKKPGETVATTLDPQVQALAGAALRRQLIGLGRERARDGAVIVVDNRTAEVLAYVGGVGGASTAPAVDNANAPRQAGSTLKPFLYGQAIERGFITAASILDDSPVQLDTASGLYVPRDYDKSFKGPVSVRTALAGSSTCRRCAPAARRSRGVSRPALGHGLSRPHRGRRLLRLQPRARIGRGDPAPAGGGLSGARRRRPLPPAAAALGDPAGEAKAVADPAAAWIVADMMADADARAVTFGLDSALRLPFWAAAKTGTSKGMRDNWCIGFSDRYTVAVWIGNSEGDSMSRVSGTSGAAPVWRDVMLALHRDRPGRAPPRPVKGIILAGGSGSRLYPATLAVSKQLLPVFDKPMIYYPLGVLMLAGIRDILIISTPTDLPRFEACSATAALWHLVLAMPSSRAQRPGRGLHHRPRLRRRRPGALILGDNIFYGAGLIECCAPGRGADQGATVFAYRSTIPSATASSLRPRRRALSRSRRSRQAQVQLGGHRPLFLRQ
jgi:penicillin-binding protein 1C